LLLAVLVLAAWPLLLMIAAPPAMAQGECGATIEGVPLSDASSPGQAIHIDSDGIVDVTATSSEPISTVHMSFQLGPAEVGVADYPVVPPSTTWIDSLDVADVSPVSVGLYRVTASAGDCTLQGWIDIEGRSPFTTVVGLAATGGTAAGLALQGAGLLRGRGGAGGRLLAALGGLPTGLGVCVLAQQHGVVPLTTEWMGGLSAASAMVGGVGNRLLASRIPAAGEAAPEATAPPDASLAMTGDTAEAAAAIEPSAGIESTATTSTAEAMAEPPADLGPASGAEAAAGAGGIAGTTRAVARGAEDPPRSAYALLQSPSVAHVGVPITVTVGISPEPTPGVVGGEMHRPPSSVGSYVLSVEVVAEGFSFGANERPRNDLPVTAENPYPSFELHLTAQPTDADVAPRAIQAMYAVDGQTIGLAVRPVAVLKDQTVVTNVAASQPPSVNISIPTDEKAPDLTIRILIPSEDRQGTLHVSLDSRYGDVKIPEESFTVDVGEDAAEYAAGLVEQVGRREGQPGLYEFLLGTGKEIAQQLPQAFWDVFPQVAAKAKGRPPAILILTQEPYIPWELAVLDPVLDPDLPPFLGAQANVGRWILADRGPTLPPPTHLEVKKCAVVYGTYGVSGVQELVDAEEEAKTIEEVYAAAAVNADMPEVLECLKGIPRAEVLHFAVHGRYDPGKPDSGLALVDGTVLAAEQIRSRKLEAAPFVFLNACQIGSGDKVLGDYAGIAAAFLYAGASGVVAPLWSVRDVLAKDIALRFYEAAFSGQTPAEIFRRERVAFQDSPKTTSATFLAYQFYGHPSLKVDRASA
jgi:CHAT domain-containing protein